MRMTVPQLSKLPRKTLLRVHQAVQLLLEYGFEEEVNLKKLSESLVAMLSLTSTADAAANVGGGAEPQQAPEAGGSLLAASPSPPPPPGMTSQGDVTERMRERQRRSPTTWALSMRQWLEVLTHIKGTELYGSLREKQSGYVSMYDVNEHFVKTWTRDTGCGLSVLMTPDSSGRSQEATLMLSHAWAEDMEQLKFAVERSLEQRGLHERLEEILVWFCVFANYQPGDDAGPTIQEQLQLMPFKRVIESAAVRSGQGMCTVHTSKADLYTRLWCVHEVAEAKEKEVPVFSAMSEEYAESIVERMRSLFEYGCDDEECLRGAGILCNSSAARCSRAEDERDLITAIRSQQHGGFAALDEAVQQFRLQHLPLMVEAMRFFARLRNHRASAEEKTTVLEDTETVAKQMEVLEQAEELRDLPRIATATISAQLEDAEDEDIRKAALGTLAAVASKVRDEAEVTGAIIPAIRSKLADESWEVRRAALHALAAVMSRISEADAAVTAAIIAAIKTKFEDEDEDRDVRVAALEALAAAATKVNDADGVVAIIDAIKVKLEDEDSKVRDASLRALGAMASKVTDPDVIVAIQAMLEDEAWEVRKGVLEAVAAFCKDSSSPDLVAAIDVAAIKRRLEDDDSDVRDAALAALSAASRNANLDEVKAILGAIKRKLDDDEWRVRGAALGALVTVGSYVSDRKVSKDIVAAMKSKLEDEDSDVRDAALDALTTLANRVEDADVVADIVAATKDKHKDSD